MESERMVIVGFFRGRKDMAGGEHYCSVGESTNASYRKGQPPFSSFLRVELLQSAP